MLALLTAALITLLTIRRTKTPRVCGRTAPRAMLALPERLDADGAVVIDLRQNPKSQACPRRQHLAAEPAAANTKVFDIVKAVPLNEVFAGTQELNAYLDLVQRQITGGDSDD